MLLRSARRKTTIACGKYTLYIRVFVWQVLVCASSPQFASVCSIRFFLLHTWACRLRRAKIQRACISIARHLMWSPGGCALLLLLSCAAIVPAYQSAPVPGDRAEKLQFQTIDGDEFTRTPGRAAYIFSYDQSDPFSATVLSSAWSVATFLRLAPFGMEFVFAPAAGTSAAGGRASAERLYLRMLHALQASGLPQEVQVARMSQLHFTSTPLAESNPWVGEVLRSWTEERRVLSVGVQGEEGWWNVTVPRLDSWYGWLPWPAEGPETSLAYLPTPCFPVHDTRLAGKWVLVPNTTLCSPSDMVRTVQRAGGKGLIIHAARHQDIGFVTPPDVDLDLEGGDTGAQQLGTRPARSTNAGSASSADATGSRRRLRGGSVPSSSHLQLGRISGKQDQGGQPGWRGSSGQGRDDYSSDQDYDYDDDDSGGRHHHHQHHEEHDHDHRSPHHGSKPCDHTHHHRSTSTGSGKKGGLRATAVLTPGRQQQGSGVPAHTGPGGDSARDLARDQLSLHALDFDLLDTHQDDEDMEAVLGAHTSSPGSTTDTSDVKEGGAAPWEGDDAWEAAASRQQKQREVGYDDGSDVVYYGDEDEGGTGVEQEAGGAGGHQQHQQAAQEAYTYMDWDDAPSLEWYTRWQAERTQEQALAGSQAQGHQQAGGKPVSQADEALVVQEEEQVAAQVYGALQAFDSQYPTDKSAQTQDEEEEEVYIPISTISFEDGMVLRDMIEHAAERNDQAWVTFQTRMAPGSFLGITSSGHLMELGWTKLPTLMHLAWAAQYDQYLDELQQGMEAEPPALELTVFSEGTQILGDHGVTVEAEMPPAEQLRSFSRLELEFALGCVGTRDVDCPAWDHIVQLFACCGQSCHACPITPWHLIHPDSAALAEHQGLTNISLASSTAAHDGAPQCGFELGRWITPFRRRTGHWLTDVTPLLPLLQPGRCSFTMQVPPWAPGWTGTLRLRFSHWDALLPQPEPAGVPLKGMLAVRPPAGVGARQAALEAASGVVSESEAKYVAEEAAWAKASLSSPGNNQHPDASLDTAPCHHHSATASTNRAHNVYVPSLTAAQLVAAQATRAAHALAATWHSVSALLNIKQATGALAPSASGPHTSSRPSLDRRLLGMDNTQVALGDAAWRAVVPLHTVLLFEGGVFNSSYNDRAPLKVAVPPGTRRAILSAVISGHGSDDNNCGEFCATTHVFEVSGQKASITFADAGTAWGCTYAVPQGSIPNEHGTWFYGRNGWCDGQQVAPWLVDVTSAIPAQPDTASNQAVYLDIQYRGLYNGSTPHPSRDPGYIMMQSTLTFFGYMEHGKVLY